MFPITCDVHATLNIVGRVFLPPLSRVILFSSINMNTDIADDISNTESITDKMAQPRLSTYDAGDHDMKLFQTPIPKAGVPVVFPQPPDDWQFNQLINEIADDIDNHDLEKMKTQCSGSSFTLFIKITVTYV